MGRRLGSIRGKVFLRMLRLLDFGAKYTLYEVSLSGGAKILTIEEPPTLFPILFDSIFICNSAVNLTPAEIIKFGGSRWFHAKRNCAITAILRSLFSLFLIYYGSANRRTAYH